ncbi:hypothetical protein CCMA1212_009391 [Trichoderma ghanense]|uniref:Uncharacterized protein n=1 Tax=Trichoderma ghanense TaxID=65468 RepID=A0ABY2GTJ4_9HYPO
MFLRLGTRLAGQELESIPAVQPELVRSQLSTNRPYQPYPSKSHWRKADAGAHGERYRACSGTSNKACITSMMRILARADNCSVPVSLSALHSDPWRICFGAPRPPARPPTGPRPRLRTQVQRNKSPRLAGATNLSSKSTQERGWMSQGPPSKQLETWTGAPRHPSR